MNRAGASHGVFTVADWTCAGLARSTLQRRVASGVVVRLLPRVYAAASAPATFEQQVVAAVRACPDLAAASHVTAAYLWNMVDFGGRPPREMEIVTRRWRRVHRSVTVHESTDLVASDVIELAGVPITTPARTLIDMGTSARGLIGGALDTALRRGLTSLPEVLRVLQRVARRGRNGVGVIRPHLDEHVMVATLTDSYLESLFFRGLSNCGVALPEPQFPVRRSDGSIICRLDFAYPAARLGVALDGMAFHSSRERFQLDRAQQNEAELAGWTTLRYTWWDVSGGMERTAAQIREALAQRSPPEIA
ncbi:MAG: endonuclease domain-containing protein [Acidimicrobiia bacterium]|nr:endonuclease domain-containing protein [Acidimicrobiia bacterium]